MPMTVSELQVKVSADTSAAESGLSALGSKVGSAGSAIATAFGGAAIAGIAALGGALAASTATAAGFESQMSAIKAVSGATGDEMESLTGLALKLGAETSFSASEAAQGIGELVKAGVSISDVMGGAAAGALSLAAAGAIEVKDAAEITSNALNAFGLSGSQAVHVADLIAGAANASAIDVNDFKFSLAAVGAVAHAVGFSLEDTTTAIALLGQAGIKGSDAGTSLKTMFLNLQPTTKEQISLFRELGLITADGSNQFFDQTGKVKDLASIGGILKESMAGLTKQQQLQKLETIFGTDALRAALVIMDAGSDGAEKMAENIGKVTAASVAAERLNNLKGDIEQLTGSLETAGIKIGTAFLPGLRSITQGATEIVNKASPILEQFAKDAASNIETASTQIQDAWRTAKQAFAGEWLPSKDIPPFVNAVGEAATKLKELSGWGQTVSEKFAEMGVVESFGRALGTAATEAGTLSKNLQDISGALGPLHEALGGAAGEATLMGGALKVVAGAADILALAIGMSIDGAQTLGRVLIDFVTITISTGKALVQLAKGDIPAATEAIQSGNKAWDDLTTTVGAFAERAVARNKQAWSDIGGDAITGAATAAGAAESGGAAVAAGVESGATAATAAAEAGMANTVGAVEGAVPAATAAGDGVGQGISGGIESAAPAMETAASQGASGAVAAVEGQTGPASAAGAAVGASIGSGLLSGIGSYIGSVAAKAVEIVQTAIAAARGEADAHSPSKKTEKLGKDLAQGLEIGLNSSNLGAEMQRKIRDFIAASREYIPVAGQIARVEQQIKDIRDQGQTDALFRAQEMIDLDSESLRLKENITRLDRDSIGFRQDLARATREIADIERGSLTQRTENIQLDDQRKRIRLEMLDLEQKLLTTEKNSDRTQSIKDRIDALRDQDRLLGIEQERITTTQSISTTAARIRREQLDDQVRGYDTIIQTIKDQIDTLGAERAVFDANEAVIKNATQNEIDYRTRLIAVFKDEARPLTDRIAAGLALVGQLEKEGAIGKDLADKLRDEAKQAGAATTATSGLGTASQIAAPQIGAAASQADRMAQEAAEMARRTAEAGRSVDGLSSSLGRLPSWFTPTGSGGNQGLFHFAEGGRPPVGFPSIVGERGREMFVPDRPGTIIPADVTRSWMGGGERSGGAPQVIRLDVAIGGQVAKQIVIEGYDLAVRRGWTPGGLTG